MAKERLYDYKLAIGFGNTETDINIIFGVNLPSYFPRSIMDSSGIYVSTRVVVRRSQLMVASYSYIIIYVPYYFANARARPRAGLDKIIITVLGSCLDLV